MVGTKTECARSAAVDSSSSVQAAISVTFYADTIANRCCVPITPTSGEKITSLEETIKRLADNAISVGSKRFL